MKILIRNFDSIALHAGDDLVLTAQGLTGDGWRAPALTTANAQLVDATLPPGWTGGVWSYIAGVWAVADTVALAARVEEARKSKVPQAVTMRQARLALLGANLLTTVSAAVAAWPGAQGDAARIEWEFSSEVLRRQPLVVALGAQLSLSELQMDNLFTLAATL